jgi:hypothetical protein
MSREQLDTLFKQYETAFNKLDLETISGYYADTFMSAGPRGVIAQNKKKYEDNAKQELSFYRKAGHKSARIISKRLMPICDNYSMVIVRWGITFEKTGSKLIEFDISYIIYETEDDPKIILFISHQDEEEALKKLGLLNKKKETNT